MEETKTEKQNYLREQILDQGYDAAEFIDYLVSLKPDGENIDIWHIDELKEKVKKFKEANNKKFEVIEESKQQQGSAPSTHAIQNLTQTLFSKDDKQNIVEYLKYNTTDRQLKKKVKCIQWKPYLNKDISSFQFSVDRPEVKVSGGIFGIGGISQIWYTVKSNLIEGQVKRQDEDFSWLRKSLTRFYPAYVVPPLKRTKSYLPEDTKALDKRTQMIRCFLNAITQFPLMFNSKLILNFFTINDYQKFERFKQDINTISFVKILPNLQTESGTVDLEISTQNQNFLSSANIYANDVSEKYSKLKNDTRVLIKNFDDVTSTMYRIGNSFADLQKIYTEFDDGAADLTNEPFTDLLINLNNTIIQWGKNITAQKKTVEKHLSVFFKYCKQENDSIRETLRRRADIEEQYIKFKINLEKKKEKVFPDHTKWELPQSIFSKFPEISKLPREQLMNYILPRQTDKMGKMREWVSYMNKNCESQVRRMLPIITSRFSTKFKDLGKDLHELSAKGTEIIGKLGNIER